MDGEITTVNWDSVISKFSIFDEHRLPLTCAFLRSDYLYGADLKLLCGDKEIKEIVQRKFKDLSQLQLEITPKKLSKDVIGQLDNKYLFPHSDVEIYKKELYVGSKSGLMRGSCNKTTKYGVSARPEKVWDGSVLGIAANYLSIALAAGKEGLYEMKLEDGLIHKPAQVASNYCTDCNWTYYSIYGSSIKTGFLASYKEEENQYGRERKFQELISAKDIFGASGYSWGVKDKLCQANGNKIKVVKYNPWKADENLKLLGSVPFESWKGEIISASVASFGVIVELENALVVFPSEGKTRTLSGEPVNWRIFPRSKHYENQLHIIYDDRLEILSFNHDYLVSQKGKLLGVYTQADQDIGKRRNALYNILSN
ncbi:hypothetical protein PJI16_05725 [Nitrospira sp. MA-1]|nr:hypothetical protein [Nitrospira sp. MA-1]